MTELYLVRCREFRYSTSQLCTLLGIGKGVIFSISVDGERNQKLWRNQARLSVHIYVPLVAVFFGFFNDFLYGGLQKNRLSKVIPNLTWSTNLTLVPFIRMFVLSGLH